MLIGTVAEVGPAVAARAGGRRPGRHAGLALAHAADHHRRPGALGRPLRAGARAGHAVLFGRSIAARLPDDLAPDLALMVMDVCGAPALVARVVGEYVARGLAPTVAVLGRRRQVGVALARRGARRRRGPLHRRGARSSARPTCCAAAAWPTRSSSPTPAHRSGSSDAVAAAGGPADVTVVCVDVPGCEQPADPRHRAGRHDHLLLDGHELLRRGARAPRAWPPTCGCSSATATCPATPTSRSTCCAAPRPCGRCSRPGSPSDGDPAAPHPLRVTHPASAGNSVEGLDSSAPCPSGSPP